MNKRKTPAAARLRMLTAVLSLSLLLGGCGEIDHAAVTLGIKDSPYYQLGDTWWDHGGIEEYCFNQIPSEENEVYRELYARISNYEDEAELYARVPTDKFWNAYYSLLADHPEFFWIGDHIEVTQAALTGEVIRYKLSVTVPAGERDGIKAQLEAAADACIARIDPAADTASKIQSVYEYLIDTTDYVEGSRDNQNIQSALLYHESVCAGYAKSFAYILHRMGLFCTCVSGTIQGGGDHVWNIVRIDDRYYNVDVTWGDPVFAGDEAGQNVREINYNYLLCTDEELAATHTAKATVPLPECSDGSYNYYRRNGMYYEYFDYETIHDTLMDSVYEGRSSVSMKFAARQVYDTARDAIFNGGMLDEPARYLMQQSGTDTWEYRYYTDETFCLIVVYW